MKKTNLINVVLVNGIIHTGDNIVIGGLLGPIKTTVKMILLPHLGMLSFSFSSKVSKSILISSKFWNSLFYIRCSIIE